MTKFSSSRKFFVITKIFRRDENFVKENDNGYCPKSYFCGIFSREIGFVDQNCVCERNLEKPFCVYNVVLHFSAHGQSGAVGSTAAATLRRATTTARVPIVGSTISRFAMLKTLKYKSSVSGGGGDCSCSLSFFAGRPPAPFAAGQQPQMGGPQHPRQPVPPQNQVWPQTQFFLFISVKDN